MEERERAKGEAPVDALQLVCTSCWRVGNYLVKLMVVDRHKIITGETLALGYDLPRVTV